MSTFNVGYIDVELTGCYAGTIVIKLEQFRIFEYFECLIVSYLAICSWLMILSPMNDPSSPPRSPRPPWCRRGGRLCSAPPRCPARTRAPRPRRSSTDPGPIRGGHSGHVTHISQSQLTWGPGNPLAGQPRGRPVSADSKVYSWIIDNIKWKCHLCLCKLCRETCNTNNIT